VSASFDVQKALYKALVDGGVCGGRIYDQAPEDALFPYYELAEPTVTNDWKSGTRGTEFRYFGQIWSEYAGNKECLDNYHLIVTAADGLMLACDTGELHAYVEGGPIQRQPDGVRRRMIVIITLSHQE